ncbi:MAG: M23 family metallopeptidase [Myxococcota bacterium]
MDTFSLIVVSDETSPVRRFELKKVWLKQAAVGTAVFLVAVLALSVDYVRMRIDNSELAALRIETEERRTQVGAFEDRLKAVDGRLAALTELERKVRIIANLPGSTASGGGEVRALEEGPGGQGGLEEAVPAGAGDNSGSRLPTIPADADVPERVSLLGNAAEYLGVIAEGQAASLEELVKGLEGKQDFLASSPSVWPAEGWLTSGYGYRTSPFTKKKQFHSGIDIAGAPGTPIIAPARGKVVFSGNKGPLGKSLTIDHGYGVRTIYGHNKELFVKRGDKVERGDKIASLGNSGRSTGPHLHYVVEVNGKTRNPLDYIFD